VSSRPLLLGLLLSLILPVTACGTSPHLTHTPSPKNTLTPTSTPPPTDTPKPFVSGECDPATNRVELDTSIFAYVAGSYAYPEACSRYCLWVPDGRQLKIGIKDFKVNLDLYVDVDLLELHYGDDTRWESRSDGPRNELVYIANPGGRYYIWVCTVEGSAMEFTLYNEFTP
jgi:hypothetical protein